VSRYFIDTDDGRTSVRDDVGFDYLSVKEAARAALNALPDMARDATPDGAQRVLKQPPEMGEG
jgi:hypothetical protein